MSSDSVKRSSHDAGIADDICDLMRTDARRLDHSMDAISDVAKITTPDVIALYHAAISLKAAVEAVCKRYGDDMVRESQDLLDRFDGVMHPRISQHISRTTQEQADSLLAQDPLADKTEAYSRLREMMSIREFVGQYGQGINA